MMTADSQQPQQAGGAKKNDAARRYLEKAFSMNPMWEAENLLELRRSALKKTKAVKEVSGPSIVEMQQRRETMRRAVQKIQHNFWTLPLDQLQRQIGAIDVKQVPELAGVVKRLRTTALCRGEFPKLASTKGMHLPLFRAFKTAVVLPPAEAGYVREQFLRTIEDKTDLKEVKKAIAVIKRDYQVLYALEKDWFHTIGTLKKPRRQKADQESGGQVVYSDGESWFSGWPVWIVCYILLKLLIAAVAAGG